MCYSSPTDTELIQENTVLKQRIRELESARVGQEQAKEALRERIKELNCLYSLGNIIENSGVLEEYFRKTVDIMPGAWYYPEYTCVRILFEDQEFKSGNFRETPWKMSTGLIVHGKAAGSIEVCYLEKMPDRQEGPFLKEERDLIDAIAQRLGRMIERKQAEREADRHKSRLESLLRIAEYSARDVQDFLDFSLNEAISLTESKIGYLYHYDDEKREFTLNSWSKEVMKECTIQEKKIRYQLEATGVWGEAVRQARPILINDFLAPNPLKKGYPEGHAPLRRFLTIPVFSNERIVAVVGVANKKSDYEESDVLQLKLLMNSVWLIMERKRVEREREDLILKLQEAFSRIKTLNGLLPICASCKKIRNDEGYWEQIEGYISSHSDAEFSHSICPDCTRKLYPGYFGNE